MAEAADAENPPDLRCGYCLERLGDISEPRYLPCNHLFCLPCLKADNKWSGAQFDCPVCK